MLAPRLTAKAHVDLRAGNPNVPRAQRREPEGVVRANVLFVADADRGTLEQRYDDGQHLFPGEAGSAQIARDGSANLRQCAAESGEAMIFCFIADFTPAFVITVLLAAAGVARRGLQVADR